MPVNIRIPIFEVVGSSLCVASEDGHKVYKRLLTALEADRNVILSFYNVNTLTSAFLNAAIGQLYGTFSEEKIRSLLKLEDIEPDDLELLKRVVDNAKLYFKNTRKYERVIREH